MERKRQIENKGFTLVELICVIVILGILAAILIPSLLGYIDKANGSQVLVDARAAYQDAQITFTEYYAKYGDDFATYFKNQNSAGFYDENNVFHRASCITHWTLSSIQSWGSEVNVQKNLNDLKEKYESGENNKSFLLYTIATDLLRKDNSLFRNEATHLYYSKERASGMTYDEFLKMQTNTNIDKANPLIYQLFFDEKGRIVMFEYGADGYLVRFYNGKVSVEKNGKTFINK